MSVGVHIVDGPIGADRAGSVGPGVGARVVFDGIVRGELGRVVGFMRETGPVEARGTSEVLRDGLELVQHLSRGTRLGC